MIKYHPLGDSAFLVKAGNDISIDSHKRIRALENIILKENLDGIIELVPTYNELMIIYDPEKINFKQLLNKLQDLENKLDLIALPNVRKVHIPVCYENEFSIDIEIVANTNHLSIDEVIHIHSSADYLVYMLGFTPGFCYLGGMDNRLITPRKESPRKLIEAGSVGIAGNQTGIYPIDSPGGWQIIGKTPLKLFDPNRMEAFLLKSGDYIKFDPISADEFEKIKSQIENKVFELKIEIKDESN